MKNFWERLEKLSGLFVVVAVFSLIFVFAHRAIFDADIWLHLKIGEFILQNKSIPSRDIFSFTLQGMPWVDHEWLFQVISCLVYDKWQAEGLILLESYVIILCFFVLFLLGTRCIRSYLEVAVFIFMVAYACVNRFNIRPDIFSMLFFALYLYLLKLSIDKKIIWLLLPIQLLWVNFHGYFFLGPLLVFLFLSAEFLRRRIPLLPWQWKAQGALKDATYKRLKRVFFFILLACLFNPAGLRGAVYPFSVFKGILLGRSGVFFKYIQELQPTFGGINYSENLYYLIIIFCLSLMLANFKRLQLVESFLLIFFFLFALTVRNVPFFVFVGFTLIISYSGPALRKISLKLELEIPLKQKLYFLLKYGLTGLLLVWIGLKINKVSAEGYYDFESKKFVSLISGVEERRYPKGAVDFILANHLKANLFNDFNSGAYLIGRAYPQRKVFIDGRTELYGEEFFKDYLALMQGDRLVFERITAQYNITAVLLSLSSTSLPDIISYLYTSPHWKMVFFDESGIVFLKDTPLNNELIKKYKLDLSKYQAPAIDLKTLGLRRVYPASFIKRASLFYLLREEGLSLQESKQALRIMPDCAQAFHILGKVYLRKGLYQEALENLRAALLFMPRNVEAWVDLGACLKELKDDESALNAFKGALKFNRAYAPAYYQLGCLYLMLNNNTQSLDALNKAIRYSPNQPWYHLKLAQALFELGKKAKNGVYINRAKDELKKASELNIQEDSALAGNIRAKLEEISEQKF